MHRHILSYTLLLLFSCTSKKVEEEPTAAALPSSATPAQITIIANLADSLQPDTIFIKDVSVPKTISISDRQVSFPLQLKSGWNDVQIEPIKKTSADFTPVMKSYTSEHGLAQDVMSWSFTDSKGNLWFGTHVGGVSKYDGHKFINYTTAHGLADNAINSINEDRKGNIWIATNLGACKFDGNTFSTFGKFKEVRSIIEDNDGNLWFATLNGLYKYAGDSIVRFSESDGLLSNKINVIKQDKNGTIWVGTDNGLFTYDTHLPEGPEKKFKRFTSITKHIITLSFDRNGNTWAGTFDAYLKMDGNTITSYPFTTAYFRYVYEDRLGNIWFDGRHEGLSYYNASTSSIMHKFHNIKGGATLTEDKSGNIWFSTNASGVIKYSGPAFQQLTVESIRTILEDKRNNIWFAGYNTLSYFDGEYLTNFELSINIWCMFEDRSGAIWMGSADRLGLIKLENNRFTFITDFNGLVDNAPQFITQDSDGNLWIGTENGLSKFNGKSFINFTKKQGLPGDLVSFILEDKPGEYLIGTNGGLSYFDGKSFTNYSISNTSQGNDIRSIIKDQNGNIWMGTYGGGLCRYDGKSFNTFTTEQGLPDNVVTQVALTKEGNIIVGTNNGIAVLTGFSSLTEGEKNNTNNPTIENYPAQNNLSNSDLRILTPVFEIYNPKTGYPVMDVNRGQHAIFEDSNGILWIASGSEKSGLMRFDYSSLYKNINPPALNIVSVKVNNELISWRNLLDSENDKRMQKFKYESVAVPASVSEEITTFGKPLSDAQREEMRIKYKEIKFDSVDNFYPVPQNLKLPYSHNNVTIEFAAIETDKPLLVQYQYKLEGYDRNWSTLANITSATYGNIHEGTYTFQLKAKSPSGIWSEPLIYTFTVLPPWWRTWWAYTLYVLAFFSGLRFFIKWRLRNLRREKEKLEKTVEIRTAEVVAEKKKTDDLLLNILPEEVAEELKAKGSAEAKQFSEVSVMFTDFKNFTQISEKLSPSELVAIIDSYFKTFDRIISKYNIEKIKTIGDSYMCASGLPAANPSHATEVVKAALEIQRFMLEHLQERKKANQEILEIRIGIHTGPVVAGIVGIKKFAYDIWGDTVNIASRMESSGEAGKVNISGTTYQLVKDQFKCVHRGKIQAKNKGEIDMYFAEAK